MKFERESFELYIRASFLFIFVIPDIFCTFAALLGAPLLLNEMSRWNLKLWILTR